MPIEQWAKTETSDEPWSSFFMARQAMEAGSNEKAISLLQSIAASKHYEPRHILQAWCFLRKLGVKPDISIEREIYGVIVEVGMDDGLI